ncbi:MAG: hypothetical protein V3U03_04665 [Myxococcota bacterium]
MAADGTDDAAARDARARTAGGAGEGWLPARLGVAAVATAFGLLAWWSWAKWTDVQIDFGNELYVPWQLSLGKVLYRDIAHRHGPLSAHLNALWFTCCGVSLRTLVYFNLAILAAICAMTFRIFRLSCGRFTATLTCLVLLGVFGFSQYVGIANYNYVTPYHHQQTHGLALSLAMILSLVEYLRRRTPPWTGLAGACLGLVFLTKAEIAAPAAATAGVGLAAILASEPGGTRRRVRLAAVFAGGALLPVAAFVALLAREMPIEDALRGVAGNWIYLGGGLFADRFYAVGAGLDDLAGNAGRAVWAFVGIAGVTGVAVAADRWLPAGPRRWQWCFAVGLCVFALLVWLPDLVPWRRLARALPLTSLAAGALLSGWCWRQRQRPASLARWAPLALWSVYAFGLLGKMILNARIHHYGFVLAMPATLLLVACLVHAIPARLGSRAGGGALVRALAVAATAAGIVFFLRWSHEFYQRRDFAVGQGPDAILVEGPGVGARGEVISRALGRLEQLMPPDATLLVLPEGIGLNYWLRRLNPTPYSLFLPAEFAAFGGDARMLEALRARPPDFIALVHRPHREFGTGPFGVDPRNGRRLMQWVNANYRRVDRIGAEPFRDRGFGVAILRRHAATPAQPPPAPDVSDALR